jgi:hypothetical protein
VYPLHSHGLRRANVSAGSTIGVLVKGIAGVCLCIVVLVVLSYAWFIFIFSDGPAEYVWRAKAKAVIIALGTLGTVGTGLYLFFRSPRSSG